MGIKIGIKDFDGRYDAAQTASLWPGIKAELNPVAVLASVDLTSPRCKVGFRRTRCPC